MKIIITEKQFKKLIKHQIIINEISNIAQTTNVTVCSLEDFYRICKNLGITPENVDEQEKYAFIEIGSGLPRWKASVHHMNFKNFNFEPGSKNFSKTNPYDLFKFQYYFPFEKKFENVLKLMYDDNQIINNKTKRLGDKNFYTDATANTENNATCVNLSAEETNSGKKEKFYYSGAIASSIKDYEAIKNFTEKMLKKNPDIKFIIHCIQGTSRSASIGTYVARKIAEIKNIDWKNYVTSYYEEHRNPTIQGKKHQFRIGRGKKGNPNYPHGNTLKGLGNIEGWNEKNSKSQSWAHDLIRDYGDMNDLRNTDK